MSRFLEDQTPKVGHRLECAATGQFGKEPGPCNCGGVEPIKSPAGIKLDAGKPRFDLVPGLGLEELARLYAFGEAKYKDIGGLRNWEKGLGYGRCFAAMMRHAWSWFRGEDFDRESGMHHMAAVAFYAFGIMHFHFSGQRADAAGVALDDRPKGHAPRPDETRPQAIPPTKYEWTETGVTIGAEPPEPDPQP
jgi:hypothetical protein